MDRRIFERLRTNLMALAFIMEKNISMAMWRLQDKPLKGETLAFFQSLVFLRFLTDKRTAQTNLGRGMEIGKGLPIASEVKIDGDTMIIRLVNVDERDCQSSRAGRSRGTAISHRGCGSCDYLHCLFYARGSVRVRLIPPWIPSTPNGLLHGKGRRGTVYYGLSNKLDIATEHSPIRRKTVSFSFHSTSRSPSSF